MATQRTVARYDDAGGLGSLEDAVASVVRTTSRGGVTLSADVMDRGDGTAVITATGPHDVVEALISWVDATY